jgi:hypothetical protein
MERPPRNNSIHQYADASLVRFVASRCISISMRLGAPREPGAQTPCIDYLFLGGHSVFFLLIVSGGLSYRSYLSERGVAQPG